MDEYIKRSDAIRASCFGCNQQFFDEPCEPGDCEIRQALNRVTSYDVVPKSEVERLEKEIKALLAFKDYFSDLYGHGLEVANWHENGKLEPFDNFYESAEDEYEAELKKKYTEEKT